MSIFKRFTSGASETKKKKGLQEELKEQIQDNLEDSKETHSEISEELDKFLPIMEKALADHMPEKIIEENNGEEDAEVPDELIRNAMCIFHVSEDKMLALACVLPPINGGKDISSDVLEKEIRYAGLSFGLDQGRIKEIVLEKEYLYPFPIARGRQQKDGRDGVIIDCFERKASVDIQASGDEVIDFSKELTMQVAQKDAILCYVQHAEKAIDGMDVVGNVLKGKDGVDVEITPGENTSISASGIQLIASIDGAVSIDEKGNFCIKPQRTISGSAGRHTGNVYSKGDMFIAGNVSGNIVVKADGDLIIAGEVTDAQLTAGGNVRIQKGIVKGRDRTIVKAGGQVQASIIDGVEIEADGSVYAEVIMEGKVTSGDSVYANSDRGLIIGGEIKARMNVTAKEIGNVAGRANKIFVGYEPELKTQVESKKAQLKESKTTLETLQRNISTLKAAGSHISQEKKELLVKLEEQRNLYETREVELAEEIKQLTATLRKASDGTVSCGKLYPTTEVFIGEKSTVMQRQMEPCRVFISGGNIVAR